MNKLSLLAIVPLLLSASCGSEAGLHEPLSPVQPSMTLTPSVVPVRGAEQFQMDIASPTITCVPVNFGVAIRSQAVGYGHTTHLGASSTADWFDNCALSATPGVLFTANGHSITSGANGDQVTSTWAMTQYANGSFVISTFTITGGTGRFANASGGATGSGRIDFATGRGFWQWSGTMTYSGH